MRILCSLGPRHGADLVRSVLTLTGATQPNLLLLHVIDSSPREGLRQVTGPLRLGPHERDPRHAAALDAAEEAAGRAVLDEALAQARAAAVAAETRLERGAPQHVIVTIAREVQASLIAIRAREHAEGHPFIGPASVGHVARFVLDHVPCDVLLLRS